MFFARNGQLDLAQGFNPWNWRPPGRVLKGRKVWLTHPAITLEILLESVGSKREHAVCRKIQSASESRCDLFNRRPGAVVDIERSGRISPRISQDDVILILVVDPTKNRVDMPGNKSGRVIINRGGRIRGTSIGPRCHRIKCPR